MFSIFEDDVLSSYNEKDGFW